MKQNKIPRNEYHKGTPSTKKVSPYKQDRIVDESVVNDPMGYWNPENFGKIVQFNAPNGHVSMQNVNFPVMAMTNKGEQNIQLPGQEYKYKGDFITEYPMAKNGGWLDSLPMAEEGIGNIPYMGVRVPYSNTGFQGPVTNMPKSNSNPFDDNLLIRQQFKESTFRPNAVSRAGARGLAQIKSDVESDAIKAGVIKQGDDIFNPEVNKKVQKWYMDNLFDSSFINKQGTDQPDSVKMAKTLAAYNWGRGNLLNYLNREKQKGVDIYKSYDWLNNLPKETHDYVNKILLKKDPKFEAEFSKAYKNYSYAYGGIPIAQEGEEFSDYKRPGPVASENPDDYLGWWQNSREEKFIPAKQKNKKQQQKNEQAPRFVNISNSENIPILNPSAAPTYISGKEQNYMSPERRAYEQSLADQMTEKQAENIKSAVDLASLVFYPAAVAGSVMDAAEGDYSGAAMGLIPWLGKAGKHGNFWAKAYTKATNAGIPHKITHPAKHFLKGLTAGTATGLQGVDVYQDNPYNMFNKAYGGIPMAQNGKTHRDSVEHQVDKILKYEQLRGGPGAHPLDGTDGYPDYRNPKYKKMLMNNILPEVNKIMPNASAIEKGEAMDFIFNTGWDKVNNLILKDPRAFALQEYYRQNDPYKLDADGKWAGRKGAAYSFDQEYANTIGKLPENERRIIMNKGRDWYYKNIDNPSPGVPNSDYYDTWYGRIWNTNDYSEFNPKNPKFKPKKKAYGGDPSLANIEGHYQGGGAQTPEEWETEIRAVEKRIGNPSQWTLEGYNELQNKLNEYKAWRENTPEGKAVVDYHNEPNEYVVFPPAHLNKEKYNMKRALELGYTPDETGHWPSVDSETGMWLKSKKHPTAWMEYMQGQLDPELAEQYTVRVNPEGYFGEDQLQYVPKKPFGGIHSKTHTHMSQGGWLDQYQPGGRTPIYVSDKNDPRYKAYSEEEIPWIEPKVKSNKVWGKNDVTDEYYKRFIKKYPGAIGLDPNKVDKDGMHAPVYPKVEKKKETINPDYLPMIQASMPEMISREPEIITSPTPRPNNTNNRISWRMDPETRKMVPVYLEGKTQKVKEGKRLYNKNIPSSTAAIPADFIPQFEPDDNADVVSKQMGGWLDKYQDAGQLRAATTYQGPIQNPVEKEKKEAKRLKEIDDKLKTSDKPFVMYDGILYSNPYADPERNEFMMMDKTGSYVSSGVTPFDIMLPVQATAGAKAGKASKALVDLNKRKTLPGSPGAPIGNIYKNNIFKKFDIPEWLKEEMVRKNLPELNNPAASKVLENFRTRIATPEGKERLKQLGITDTKVFDDLKIVRDTETLGNYWHNRIGIHPELPEVKKVTRHEIEHAVQDALGNSRTAKYNTDANNFKYLFRPKAKKKAIEESMKQTSDIDDILGGLELRKTPEKVDWAKLKESKERKNPSNLFDYMSDKQRATNYFDSGSGGKEKSAFLGEVQQHMMDKGIIPSDSYKHITPEMVKETFIDAMFDEKGGKYLRLFNIMKPTENNYNLISKGLNKMLGISPYIGIAGAGALGAKALEQQKEGGWLDAYDDEYRRGGQRRKKRGTSKNIQSSINDVFRRNYDIYGPAGRNRYDPTAYKTGGWLDNVD